MGGSSRPSEQQLLLQCAAEAASWQRAHWQGAEVKGDAACLAQRLLHGSAQRRNRPSCSAMAQPLYEHLSETQKEVVRRVRALSDEPD